MDLRWGSSSLKISHNRNPEGSTSPSKVGNIPRWLWRESWSKTLGRIWAPSAAVRWPRSMTISRSKLNGYDVSVSSGWWAFPFSCRRVGGSTSVCSTSLFLFLFFFLRPSSPKNLRLRVAGILSFIISCSSVIMRGRERSSIARGTKGPTSGIVDSMWTISDLSPQSPILQEINCDFSLKLTQTWGLGPEVQRRGRGARCHHKIPAFQRRWK